MSLHKKIFEQTILNIVQQVQKFAFGTLLNILIIRVLDRSDYGLVGLFGGFFVIVSWLLVMPQNILLQKYEEIRNGKFKEYLSMFFTFSYIKYMGLMLFSLVLGGILCIMNSDWSILPLFMLFSISQLLIFCSGELQQFLKYELQQKYITLVTTVFLSLRLGLLTILIISPGISQYLLILIITGVVEVFVYARKLQSDFHFAWYHDISETFQVMKKQLADYAIWQYVGSNLTKYIYEIDVVFLGMWAGLVTVGNFSIALKIANYTFIFPQIIQNSTALALMRKKDALGANRIACTFLKYSFLTSLVQLLGFIVMGKWYISLHTETYVEEIFKYALFIMGGTSLINAVRPLIGYVYTKLDVRAFFFQSILPSAMVSTVLYLIGAYKGGGIGVALANVGSYAFMSLSIISFVWRKGFHFKFVIVEDKERELASEMFWRVMCFFSS